MVFQDYALFPHMDVMDNISYPLRIQKVPGEQRRQKAAQTGAGLGLSHLMERRPGQLSGGQQQRVALARAIACQPAVFLFDEPLSNLDARLRLEARTFLKRLQHELRVTTVFVTHDQAEALAMADKIAVMEAGTIRQLGTPSEIFHRPANVFVANFIGSTPMNLVPGSAFGDRVEGGDEVLVGFRPEYAHLGADGPYALRGQVAIVENLGASMLVSVQVGEQSVQALVPEGEEPDVGTQVTISPDRRACCSTAPPRVSSSGRASRRCGEPMSHGATLLDLRSTWTPHHRAERPLQELEVEVPARVQGIEVALSFDGSGDGVLDLGLEGPAGYVGWSGAARGRAVVSADWATPGYLPVPQVQGRWLVLIGLHRVPPPGVPFHLRVTALSRAEVEAERRASEVPAPPPAPGPAPGGCPGSTACSGLPGTSTPTPCTPTAASPWPS